MVLAANVASPRSHAPVMAQPEFCEHAESWMWWTDNKRHRHRLADSEWMRVLDQADLRRIADAAAWSGRTTFLTPPTL